MFIHINNAKYIDEYKVYLLFNDGKKGVVDLKNELDGEIFKPLKNINFFKSFKLNDWTLTWENGADFAPEYLHNILNNH
jgi:hypothetical protein